MINIPILTLETAIRFNYLAIAFALGALCHSISHFGMTLNVVLVSCVVAVVAVVNLVLIRADPMYNRDTPM